MRLNTYLMFKGQCDEAITFYHSVLGGEIKAVIKVAGSPAEPHFPPESKNDLLHACLTVANMDIMASDCPPSMYDKMRGASVCINLEDEKEADRIFAALSKGGEIIMGLEQTFFAKKYGQFVDRFGTRWMIHCA
ncbi:VOC family protein [Hyphococcus sp.]|uniref:VOC family protein n=1 Tax=Hyphococcus sp. TaxID=2038636 RepID=UPI0020897E45|nr:MAG: VOC family protein [Marinicaulis sp.]